MQTSNRKKRNEENVEKEKVEKFHIENKILLFSLLSVERRIFFNRIKQDNIENNCHDL